MSTQNGTKSGSSVELREISKNKQNHCALVASFLYAIKTRSYFIKTYKDIDREAELVYLKYHCLKLKRLLDHSFLLR